MFEQTTVKDWWAPLLSWAIAFSGVRESETQLIPQILKWGPSVLSRPEACPLKHQKWLRLSLVFLWHIIKFDLVLLFLRFYKLLDALITLDFLLANQSSKYVLRINAHLYVPCTLFFLLLGQGRVLKELALELFLLLIWYHYVRNKISLKDASG